MSAFTFLSVGFLILICIGFPVGMAAGVHLHARRRRAVRRAARAPHGEYVGAFSVPEDGRLPAARHSLFPACRKADEHGRGDDPAFRLRVAPGAAPQGGTRPCERARQHNVRRHVRFGGGRRRGAGDRRDEGHARKGLRPRVQRRSHGREFPFGGRSSRRASFLSPMASRPRYRWERCFSRGSFPAS